MNQTKPHASVSLDLDNLWSYMKTHGNPAWSSYPTYLDRLVPVVLDVLRPLGWKITVFVVGADAARQENTAALRSLIDAGHEFGNHSFHHEPWLHLYERERLVEELSRTEEALRAISGVVPNGFRGPGYSCSNVLLEVLAQRGYAYDASTLPTWLGPIARWYYFRTAKLDADQRRERAELFGSWRDACRPVGPYRWALPHGASLIELPVTTAPILRVPFHLSYVLYLGTLSTALAEAYFDCTLRWCALMRTQPSVLLHPLDFVGAEDVSELAFFPAMRESGASKRALLSKCLARLDRHFKVANMSEHISVLRDSGGLKDRRPDLRPGRQ